MKRPEDSKRQAHRLLTKTGSFSNAARLAPGKYYVAGRIVQLKVIEGNGDEFAAQSGKVADGKNDIVIAILAENEIIDSPDCLALTTLL